jgi:hypothetical protein
MIVPQTDIAHRGTRYRRAMVTQTSTPDLRSYAGPVAAAAAEAALNGAWVAAGELPMPKRRLARVGLTAAVAALTGASTFLGMPSDERPEAAAGDNEFTEPDATDDMDDRDDRDDADGRDDDRPDEPDDPTEAETSPFRPLLDTTAGRIALGISVGIMLSSSFLRKRWLAGLSRSGHPHPHRALALRVAAVSFAAALPARLIEAREPAAKRTDC